MSRRRKSGRFAMLPLRVLNSEAVRTLSHPEFRVLVLYCGCYAGANNGDLGITIGQAADHSIPRNSFLRARRALEERGLIRRTREGTRTPPRPHLYALTWVAIDEGKHDAAATRAPSNEYKDWPDWPAKTDSDTPQGATAIPHRGQRTPLKRVV